MAIHLTSSRPTATGTRHLAALGSHLLCISKKTSWTNKELIVTPSEERFTTVAACGICDGENYTYVKSGDVDSVKAEAKKLFDSKTTNSSWNSGHKSCYSYWVRGYEPYDTFGEGQVDPYYILNVTKAKYESDKRYNTLGCGMCWQALRFNLFALPIEKATSFNAYIRLYHPSWMSYEFTTFESSPSGRLVLAPPLNQVNSAAFDDDAPVMRYAFFDHLINPAEFKWSSSSDTEMINMASSSVSNMGRVYTVGNSPVTPFPDPSWYCSPPIGFKAYDVYDHKNISDSWRKNKYKEIMGSGTVPVYNPNNDGYYSDVAVTSSMIEKMKSIQANGHGDFWMVIGPPILSPLNPNHRWGVCSTTYFSRVELRLVLSMTSFNN